MHAERAHNHVPAGEAAPGGCSAPETWVGPRRRCGDRPQRERWPRGVAAPIPEPRCDFLAQSPRQRLQAPRLRAARPGRCSRSPVSAGKCHITALSRCPPLPGHGQPSEEQSRRPALGVTSKHRGCGSNPTPFPAWSPSSRFLGWEPGVEPAPRLWISRFSLRPWGSMEVERGRWSLFLRGISP